LVILKILILKKIDEENIVKLKDKIEHVGEKIKRLYETVKN
jgi:hypothetical protein